MGASRTLLLFVAMTALSMAVGWALGGIFAGDAWSGMIVFLVLAVLINGWAYFRSDKHVLRRYGAREVTLEEEPRLHAIIDGLAAKMGIPKPRVAIIPSETPNAFATGRNRRNAVVAATQGIMTILDDRELAGVFAHELAHVKNRDVLTSTIAATFASAITFATRTLAIGGLAGGRQQRGHPLAGVLVLLAPIAGLLLRLGIGRSREFEADHDGAVEHGDPQALASALVKLDRWNQARPMLRGSPATANLFIVNPFRGRVITGLFSTHPPIAERVRRLQELAG